MNKSHMEKRSNQLPNWLWANSTTLPPIYRTVWEAVREDKVRSNGTQAELLVDTNKVFPLLLTSQLPTEVLGHIWGLANRKYAGQLTEQELYIVLALVAAAQASYTFNSLDILHLLPFPPTPYLNIECVLNVQPSTRSSSVQKSHPFNHQSETVFSNVEGRYRSDTKGRSKANSGSVTFDDEINSTYESTAKTSSWSNAKSQASNYESTVFRDTKQDIKRTPVVSDPNDDFTEFQSAPIASIPAVTTVPTWDAKQGSAIGSRLANHNLGVKKPIDKLKRNNAAAKTTHIINVQPKPIINLNFTSPNKDQSSGERLSELFPKCSVKNQSKTVILKDTAIRNSDLPKENNDDSKDIFPITSFNVENKTKPAVKWETSENTIAQGELNINQARDLMNLQPLEDKYSALRALVQEASPQNEENLSTNESSSSIDEFGEFVSAEQPIVSVPSTNVTETESFANIFMDFEVPNVRSNTTSGVMDSKLNSEISETFENLKLEDSGIEHSTADDKFDLTVETEKVVQKEDAVSINSMELINGISGALTRSGSVPSLDLKLFLPSNLEDEQLTDNSSQSIYWEWKQYMESCVLLLQIAANAFSNITSEQVLSEVVNSAQGYNFLCNLAEVAAVCRRVNFSYKEMDINIVGFDDLLMDIDRIWADMEPFYTNIPIVTELPAWPLHQVESIFCSLCLTVVTSDRVVYNDYSYHATCANLWLNCVNSHLPAMRYPTFYSNLCAGNSNI